MMLMMRDPRFVTRPGRKTTALSVDETNLVKPSMVQPQPQKEPTINPAAMEQVANEAYSPDVTAARDPSSQSPTPWGDKIKYLRQQGMKQKITGAQPTDEQKGDEYAFSRFS